MSSGQAKVYMEQGATGQVVASGGRILVEAGGSIVNNGAMTLPGVLGQGYIPLNLQAGLTKTTATASGLVTILATGNPSYKTPGTTNNDFYPVLRWTSAAGVTADVWVPPVPIPHDYSTAGGMTLHVKGERSSAQTTNAGSGDLNVRVYANIATTTGLTNIGTTMSLTSAAVINTMALTSGNVPATGFLTVIFSPDPHASGTVDMYSAHLTYTKKTS